MIADDEAASALLDDCRSWTNSQNRLMGESGRSTEPAGRRTVGLLGLCGWRQSRYCSDIYRYGKDGDGDGDGDAHGV